MTLDADLSAVAKALRELESQIERLNDALAHEPLWLRIEGQGSEAAARRALCDAYATIDYAMDDEAGRTAHCAGVVGVSAATRQRASAVNTAKAQLKLICAPLNRRQMREAVKHEDAATRVMPVIRVILRRLQRSDLNLLAAYRRIPILGAAPALIVYTRAHTRAVYRRRIEEIETKLFSSDAPTASADRARLAALPPAETHLALVREHYENLRANVRYHALDARGRGRVQLPAELPLLYAVSRHHAPPQVRFPPSPDDASAEATPRRVRASRLETQPFLKTLPVYRYRPRSTR